MQILTAVFIIIIIIIILNLIKFNFFKVFIFRAKENELARFESKNTLIHFN